jgi:hypothetical protein
VKRLNADVSVMENLISSDSLSQDNEIPLSLDHVISRDSEGKKVSVIGDFCWDLSVYDPRGENSKLYFDYWREGAGKSILSNITAERVLRMREMQLLLALLIYREDKAGFIAAITINKTWLSGLALIARFAESQSCSLREVLARHDLLDIFIITVPNSAAHKIVGWLHFLWKLDSKKKLGYLVAKPRRWAGLQKQAKACKDSLRQHAPLPSRIYSSVINSLRDELDDIEEHSERLIGALRASIAESRSKVKDWKGEGLGPGIISRYSLEEYFARRGFSNHVSSLGTAVREVFRICKLQIHLFSGMRDAEAQHLPFHCMITERRGHGRKHCLIAGVTTKLEGGQRRSAKWVTTEKDGFRAVHIAQKFASIVYGSLGITPSASEGSRDKFPLFIATGYLPWGGGRSVISSDDASNLSVSSCDLGPSSTRLRERLVPAIEEDDLAELESIEPFRAWRDEAEYAVGQLWPLKPHQLRRSLALYANASGLVRLSSLVRQLQHITREMSLYYARGSAYAINFIAEDPKGYTKHIVGEWQDGEKESQYLAFVQDVLKSDEPMYGAAGSYYEMQRKRGEILSLDDFKKQIKMGRLAYRKSPLGGCTNPSACESSKGLRLVDVSCATEGCKHLIGKHSKILQTIRLQRAALSHVDVNSITYQLEKEDLDALVATEVLWRPSSDVESTKGGAHV